MEMCNILLKEKQLLIIFLLLAVHMAIPAVTNKSNSGGDCSSKIFASQKKMDFSFCYEELLDFIGITIAMGLSKLPQICDYWSKEQVLATPWFPAIMSRDHYFLILQYFHLVDSSLQKKKGETGYNPLFKVRPPCCHFSYVLST